MSANKFKVGDKVKVREGLVVDKKYDGVYYTSSMANMSGKVLTIYYIGNDFYEVKEHDLYWSDEMLELAEKALDNLCAGDFIESDNGIKKVLAAVDGCYLISYIEDHNSAAAWYTAAELGKLGYRPAKPDAPEPTIEISGKKYKKADVMEAIKDLEPID